MAVSRFVGQLGVLCLLAVPVSGIAYGQAVYTTNGIEYAIAGLLPGDQVHPQLAVGATNGYLVWQDNRTDGLGLGISARRLNASFSGALSTFRVNVNGTNDQENPQVSLLKSGGAAFVWQGGRQGYQQIFARFMSASNTWATGDVRVSTNTSKAKLNPAITTLADGNVMVVWSSFNQRSTDSVQDIYGQRLSPNGQKLGPEFAINQFNSYSQRTPTIATLSDGRFVVVCVSEQQTSGESVDIYARLFTTTGSAVGNEFRINTGTNLCANPSVGASPSYGGFIVAWGEHARTAPNTGWDIVLRAFSSSLSAGDVQPANTHLANDQLAPRVATLGSDYLVVWMSDFQDSSREGIFGRFFRGDGTPAGAELQVNTTVVSRQIQPAVASNGSDRFLVAWSSFTGLEKGMDLFAQRYSTDAEPLGAPDPPYVTALSSNSIALTWAPIAGYNIASYEVYADGVANATVSTSNTFWTMTGVAASSVHTFKLAYVLKDGRRSPLSASVVGRTYSANPSWGGIPQEWMIEYFGSDILSWPSPNADTDGDGVSNLNEFLAGTDPTDAHSVLRVELQPSHQGLFLNWNTQPGLLYQVQTSPNLSGWVNVGAPRFSAGRVDSLYVGAGNAGYFRVLRVR